MPKPREQAHHREQRYPEHDPPRGRAFEHLEHRDQERRIAGHVLDGVPEDHVVDDDLPHPRGQYDCQVLGNPMAHEADDIPDPHVPEEQHASADDPEGLAVIDVGLAVGETRALVQGLLVLAQGAQREAGVFGFPFPGDLPFGFRHRPGRPCFAQPGSPRIARTLDTGPGEYPSGSRDCRSPRCGRRRDRGCCPRGGWSKSGG